ncbi:MAG: FAD-dependent oxidoreductase [Lachnospiraceae bacterium]
MAVITIDGTRLEVPEGKNILECALDAGIYIPHLCHHKDLNPLGSCRMCIVEVEGEKGVTTSCTLQAKDGLNIRTNNEEIKKLRMLALELLLTGHPEECTGCPKYGNCELQTLIQYIGPKTGRMKMRTKGFKPQDANPLLVHDMNRCVLCGRCVRACNEMRGVKVLQYNKKELESYIGTLHNKTLKDADCRFCGACAEVCPTGTIRDKMQLLDSGLKKEDAYIPCRYACPAHTDVPRYIRFAKEGRYDEAGAVIREKVQFPKTLGYICSHVCEAECKRRSVNDPMSIRNIKRYIAERDTGSYWKGKGKQKPETGKSVCVVGGGPSGMTAAFHLKKLGYDVTIKEALPDLGGMTRYGIPSYRLPREVIAEECAQLEEIGIKVETNVKVTDYASLSKEFDAVLSAVGSHKGIRLPIEGNSLEQVLLNTDFLREASMGKNTGMGEKVVVLGGGNVAFDCARTAKRLGAKEVHLACLETQDTMTADLEEIQQGQEEGILLHPAKTFEKISGTTTVTGVDFMNVLDFSFDENRRPVIQKEEGSELHIDADTVIFAVGQKPDLAEALGLPQSGGGYIAVKQDSLQTEIDNVFACGDVVYGTKSVIMAIASGREAASEIDRFLGGDGDISEKFAPDQIKDDWIGREAGFGYEQRRGTSVLSAERRSDNFELIDQGICDLDICGETSRCLQCDLRLKISSPRIWSEFQEVREEV